MYTLSRKTAYLKSEIFEIGRFWAISGLFPDFLRFGRYEWEAGHDDCAWGDGWGLTNSPRRWGGFMCAWGVGGAKYIRPRGFGFSTADGTFGIFIY